jgi:hypothetical protein
MSKKFKYFFKKNKKEIFVIILSIIFFIIFSLLQSNNVFNIFLILTIYLSIILIFSMYDDTSVK